MAVRGLVLAGCAAAVAATSSGEASSWGCPFTGDGNPCYNGDCLQSRVDGEINAACCQAIAEYCEAQLDSGSDADQACSDSDLMSLFQSACGMSSSSSVHSVAGNMWSSLAQSNNNAARAAGADVGASGWQNCPFSRPYDNPCYVGNCSKDGSHGGLTLECCDAIETYCVEEIDTDPACRNPDLGGLFFVFCNSSFADPDSPNYIPPPLSPKAKKGGAMSAIGGPAGAAAGAAAVGAGCVLGFFAWRHYKARHANHDMNQRILARADDMEAPLVPPKYDESKGGDDTPPGYFTMS